MSKRKSIAASIAAACLLLSVCSFSGQVLDSPGKEIKEENGIWIDEEMPGCEGEEAVSEEEESVSERAQTSIEEDKEMILKIAATQVPVTWEENDSVQALKDLTKEGPLTIQMSMYGGFEQVGPIGQDIVSADKQTTTQAGDIVLYSSDQIVIFYGSNSWAYTRLGHVDLTKEEMTKLLGNGDVELILQNED